MHFLISCTLPGPAGGAAITTFLTLSYTEQLKIQQNEKISGADARLEAIVRSLFSPPYNIHDYCFRLSHAASLPLGYLYYP